MIASPTATSAAAMTNTKITKTLPRWSRAPYRRENATRARFAALSISSTHMRMTTAFRRTSTPAQPMKNNAAETATYAPSEQAKPKPKPAVQRGKVYVEVYNNSGVTGLAGRVADRAIDMGWQVVGSDNWYGTVPATTVYYPERLKRAAKTLALDLGIQRTALAVDPMRRDRLTLILTAPLD